MKKEQLVPRFIKMLGCDTARIVKYDKYFLIIGRHCNTAKDREKDLNSGQWYRNGVPYDFNYVQEEVIASGKTLADLTKSAEHYKRLTTMPLKRFLKEMAACAS